MITKLDNYNFNSIKVQLKQSKVYNCYPIYVFRAL